MIFLFAGVVAGVLGTLAMDVLNPLLAKAGILSKIDVRGIGRMAAGWTRGRFRYAHPDEMEHVPNELLIGYLTHYAIGIGLAVPFVSAWALLAGGLVPPVWAFIYGVATTVASVFLVYPSMGFGICGLRSPDRIKAPLSSLANHVFYGAGLAAGVSFF